MQNWSSVELKVNKSLVLPSFLKVIKEHLPSLSPIKMSNAETEEFLKEGYFSRDNETTNITDVEDFLCNVISDFVSIESDCQFSFKIRSQNESSGGEYSIDINYAEGAASGLIKYGCCWDSECPDCIESGKDVFNMVSLSDFQPNKLYKCEVCGKEYSSEEILSWNDMIDRFEEVSNTEIQDLMDRFGLWFEKRTKEELEDIYG